MTEPKAPDTETDGQSSRKLAQALGKLIALVLVVVLVVLIERYCVPKPVPFGPNAKIVTLDGDTIKAGDGVEYRIFGIDAPELRQTCNEANGKSWMCGRAAKAKLTTLIKGGNVNCQARETDRFGRIVAVCSAEGVPDLGEAMVREGYAIDLGGAGRQPLRERRDGSQGRQARHLARHLRAPLRLAPSQSAIRRVLSELRRKSRCPGSACNSTTRPGRRSTPWRGESGKTFQQLADEAFKDLLEKHRQPVGLKAALKQSVGGKGKVPAREGINCTAR